MGTGAGAALFLAAGTAFIIYLAENSRIPVDDPTTHLELTMIHEVMVLDHGGIDLAYIQYGAALKLWVLGGLVVAIAAAAHRRWPSDLAIGLGGMRVRRRGNGVVESAIARLRLARVPQLLVAALAMAALAFALAVAK